MGSGRLGTFAIAATLTSCTCDPPSEAPSAPEAVPAPRSPFRPEKVDRVERAMGTEVRIIAYTTPDQDPRSIHEAMSEALAEIHRLEVLMTSWRDDSDVGRINARSGEAVPVSVETFEVFEKAQWISQLSDGVFDVSFNVMSGLWRFGDAAEGSPRLPSPEQVEKRRRLIDYRKVILDPQARTVRIDPGMSVGLGGIAKGYAVDRAARILKRRGLVSYLLQAGGDLYGAGRKPDGSPWTSGIQDPRRERGAFFATLELEDRAFSTAGDYARSFFVDGRRYHHIIDPRTGYPATESRSVTIWAETALVADAIDDAVFILGPERGLELVESLPGVGAVIVDSNNRVHVSRRLEGKVRIHGQPTDGP